MVKNLEIFRLKMILRYENSMVILTLCFWIWMEISRESQ
jgi:hypothetical protein